MDPTASLLAYKEALASERKPWEPLFQEITDYMQPKRASWTTNLVPGDNKYDYLHDYTAPWALDQFANGLHSMLTSPLSRWFTLQFRREDAIFAQDMQEWLSLATEILYDQFNSALSSFHPSIQEVYTDLGAVGYGVLYSEWADDEKSVQFQARFPGECYLVEDAYGRVKGVIRCYKVDISQFVEMFGVEKLPEGDKQALANGKPPAGKKYEIVHAVLPRDHYAMKKFKVPRTFPYGSVRVCKDCGPEPLTTGGYSTFPYHVARWARRTGEVYSNSPGMMALPSARRVNAMQVDLTKIVNRWADPPMQAPDDEFLSPFDLSPGAINYYRPGSGDRIETITGQMGDISPATVLVQNAQQEIVRAFFVDAFMVTGDSNGQNVKATFVNQRRDERFRQLAAALSRVERELLGSIVDRTYQLCLEKGLIPEPPPVPGGIRIEYTSPITRAQRSEVLDGLYQQIEMASLAAQFDPSVMGSFNWDRIMSDTARDVWALPGQWYRGEEEMQAIRQQQAEAQQAQALQQESAAVRNLAGAVKDVGQANLI